MVDNQFKECIIKDEKEIFLALSLIAMLASCTDSIIYMIDDKKIFLHANCTRGYRALRIAEDYPDKFAAIDLYEPV